jgi:toxin FitB
LKETTPRSGTLTFDRRIFAGHFGSVSARSWSDRGIVNRWQGDQRETGQQLYSVVTISEIQQGISKLRRKGGIARAEGLSAWLSDQLSEFADRVIQIDNYIAYEAGNMSDAATAAGRNPGFADMFIAATAKVRNIELLTCNTRHFQFLGIRHSNPFDD